MDYEFPALPYIISNLVAVLIIVAAISWPTVARVALGAIFIASFFFNCFTLYVDPQVYLGYADLTPNELYRSIIVNQFSQHIVRYVLLLATCQLLIGIFTLYEGKSMKMAMVGGILFLVAIAPLGIGSAFPSTLLMAIAFSILLRKDIKLSVFEIIMHKLHFTH